MEQGIGGGMLQIDSKDGAIVKMGHVGNRYGIVMAGPRPGLPLVPKSGLPVASSWAAGLSPARVHAHCAVIGSLTTTRER